ncbi:MAG: STAS domain-containing protein [Syntrophorhabdaceae bacterium]
MEQLSSERGDIAYLKLAGRIDSITCRETDSLFRDAVMAGKRIIIADLKDVNYVSSAGLRVFLSIQKELKKAGGQVCFFNTSPSVYSVFETSGFTTIFRFLESSYDLQQCSKVSEDESLLRDIHIEGGDLRILSKDRTRVKLTLIGCEQKLASAGYTREDVISVNASAIDFATGLAALGTEFDDYKGYFGETIVINGNLFVYPAIPRSAVDFIIHKSNKRDAVYHFLHGFSFPEEFRHIAAFEPSAEYVTLDQMIDSILQVTDSPVIGISGIFESKGLFGMRLKKIPLQENAGVPGIDIFSSEHFSDWIDYSIEAEDVYNLMVITGIAVREKTLQHGSTDEVIPKGSRFHIHGVVFDKKPFNKDIDNFSHELDRIVAGMEPQKVLHLLGKSRVGSGLMGIVEIDG